MAQAKPQPSDPPKDSQPGMSAEVNKQLRTLAHDLSNSIETIMQASYLLQQSQLDDVSKRWADMIDNAVRESARINRDIREVLRAHAPH
jgi:signal transduction histidine kinase